MLPIMLSVTNSFPDFQFVIAGVSTIDNDFYDAINKHAVPVIRENTYRLLSYCKAALVTSGTATLETALFNVPQVVCYKGSFVSYFIARVLIKVKYISLVNLIANREIVKELIQKELNAKTLKNELNTILSEPTNSRIKAEYVTLRQLLGGKGASERMAIALLKTL